MVLVIPPPLAMPGTVNVKPQSPVPCARWTRWGSWSNFFPFSLSVAYLFSAHSKCWPLYTSPWLEHLSKMNKLCKNTTFFLDQFPKERSCKQSSCLSVCLGASSSWVTYTFTNGISISTKVDRSLQDISKLPKSVMEMSTRAQEACRVSTVPKGTAGMAYSHGNKEPAQDWSLGDLWAMGRALWGLAVHRGLGNAKPACNATTNHGS